MRVAGVMSGTSLDGIDVVVVDIRGRRIRTVGFQSTPYSAAVRAAILAVSDATATTGAIARLHFQLGELYARAVLRAVKKFGPVELVGCHGQTIYHEGGANTLQIGEAAVIAGTYRRRDRGVEFSGARYRRAGGQRARPLFRLRIACFFGIRAGRRIALNIGGIANITVMPVGVAFDTGPGNMVIDALARADGEAV